MKAEILAVGTEILMGQICNTNAQYISGRLQDIGVNVYYHSVVGDNAERLRESLRIALQRSDVVIITGGLGPTQDDLTKETVADVSGKKLVLDENSLLRIKEIFKKSGWPMVDSNLKQAYFPEESIVMKNDYGTAPGCIVNTQGKVIMLMPGPPSEMKPMFEQSVVPYLEEKSQFRIVSKYLNIFGIGESSLEEMLIDLIDTQKNTTIATYAKESEVALRLTTKCAKDNTEDLSASIEEEIRKRLGNAIYSTDDCTMEQVVGKLLIEADLSISIEESFTGGLVSAALMKVPGITRVFTKGIISTPGGSISKETAIDIAEKVRKTSNTDIGLSILGREEDGNGEKTEGLVYLALASRNKHDVKIMELKLFGNQNRRKNYTMLQAFNMIRLNVK